MTTLDRFAVVPMSSLYDELPVRVAYVAPKAKTAARQINNPLGRSGIRGVYSRPGLSKPWYSLVRVNGRLKHIGYFVTKEEAKQALDDFNSSRCCE